jgi:large subunit ribosomal protein L21
MKSVEKPVFNEYAIFQTGGKQFQAIPGKTVSIEKIDGAAGESLSFDKVLFRKNGDNKFEIGQPYVKGATVRASIIKQTKNSKVVVFKFHRRKRYKVKKGHRQLQTIIRIESI